MSVRLPTLMFVGLTLAGCGSKTSEPPGKPMPLAPTGSPPDYAKIRGQDIAVNLFEQLTPQQQSDYLLARINAVIALNDLMCEPFTKKLRNYYLTVPAGGKKSQGMVDFDARVRATKGLAKKGGADAPNLDLVSINEMFVALTKDKFPSYYQDKPNPEQVEGMRKYKEMSDLIDRSAKETAPTLGK